MAKLRLFIAIETPAQVRSDMSKVRDQLRESGADVRWEPEEKFHATLKFLGGTEGDLVPEIIAGLRSVAGTKSPLSIMYRSVGCFPNLRNPRVVWIGIEDNSRTLMPLQQSIESAMSGLGFKPEDRPYHAHVTLGRVRSTKKIRNLLTIMESITFESQPVTIREIAVVRSDLRPTGSVYTTLHSIPLGS
jgi:2'-5' RNA ligase